MVGTQKETMRKVAPKFTGKAQTVQFVFTVTIGKIEMLAAVRESKQDIWEAGPLHLCCALFPVFHFYFICLHCRLRLAERLGK